MKFIPCLIAYFILPQISFCQEFTLNCQFTGKRIPELYYVPGDNVFQETIISSFHLIKDNDSTAHLKLIPSKISFSQMGGDQLMIVPGEKVEGRFDGDRFYPSDTSTANYKLSRISNVFLLLRNQYGIGDNFKKFKSTIPLLQHFIDSANKELDKNIKPFYDPRIELAIKEYLKMALAHFFVLPVLYRNEYNATELNDIILKNIHISFPDYWLQTQSGRIFLQNYYRKIVLPRADYDFDKSLKNPFFSAPSIKKFVQYNYFEECLEKGIVKTKDELRNDYQVFIGDPTLTTKEKDYVQDDIYRKIQRIGSDISEAFMTLPIVNSEGRELTEKEKAALVSGNNIILDFWASWCAPCRAKMEKLNSNKVVLYKKEYHFIYLSIDAKDKDWKNAAYPFQNKNNSFRITGPDNPFVKEYALYFIPRYILVNHSGVISEKFEF